MTKPLITELVEALKAASDRLHTEETPQYEPTRKLVDAAIARAERKQIDSTEREQAQPGNVADEIRKTLLADLLSRHDPESIVVGLMDVMFSIALIIAECDIERATRALHLAIHLWAMSGMGDHVIASVMDNLEPKGGA